MALTDPQDTLAYHSSRVLCAKRDMSAVLCKSVADRVAIYQQANNASDGYSVPETQALWFYGMNHGMALIGSQRDPLEPLNDWELEFVEAYHKELAPRAIRAFYYLLLICTREARHNKSLSANYAKMVEKFGTPVADFFKMIKGGEASIHQEFLKNPPDASIGAYCECMQWQFYNSKWAGGYGGPAWGSIADCLVRFVKGEYSAEMMLDTVWTLSHNNGPIFNKSLFYGMYNHAAIIRILDIQRSGQIPQAVLFDGIVKKYINPELVAWMQQVKDRFPDKIGDYVDWEVVEALGSVKKYQQDKQQQWSKHGMSPAAQAALKAAEAKKKAQEEAAKKAAEEHAKNWFQVMPGLEVKKIQIIRSEAA
ncbi:MAG: hypothetical protein KJZ83_00420 [Burkholderiaceae bacterium]|nr:hypothetical protein [Burkholderiaceae bacterium]